MICLAIMKNDKALETLGYSRRPCELYMTLKKMEISQRPNTQSLLMAIQRELF